MFENTPKDFNSIDNHVKQQIANIMNMFSRYTPIATAHPIQYSSDWSAGTPGNSQGSNFWINNDLTANELFNDWTKTTDNTTTTLDANTTSATKNHNGVTWTYSNSNPSGGAGGVVPGGRAGDSITITSDVTKTPINIYRTITTAAAAGGQARNNPQWDSGANANGGKFNDNQGRQTYFSTAQANGAPSTSVKVKVTMKIVVATSKN